MPPTKPGPIGFRISPIASRGIDWPKLDATWARAGQLSVFDAGWMSDHLSDASRERGGGAFESLTTAAALAHRVPGKWIGIAVLSNTFRHPAVLAKAATVLDNATAGRFILGLGAGWHVGEHGAFGVPLPPMPERYDQFESAIKVLHALFSEDARTEPGVSLEDAFYPLHDATLEPGPVRPEGPALWLGGQKRRGIGLAVRYAEGWPMPGNQANNVAYFTTKRDEIRRALDAAGRDPSSFTFAGQVNVELSAGGLREARGIAQDFARAGADHVIIGVPGTSGPDGLVAMAREVAQPLREILN